MDTVMIALSRTEARKLRRRPASASQGAVTTHSVRDNATSGIRELSSGRRCIFLNGGRISSNMRLARPQLTRVMAMFIPAVRT